jgi:hypothetical protein
VLRFLGVTRIYQRELKSTVGVTPAGDGTYKLEKALPRVLLLSESAYAEIEKAWGTEPVSRTLERIQDDIRQRPGITNLHVGTRTIDFDLGAEFDGVLVGLQAYSHSWTFEGREAQTYCELFPAWRVHLAPGVHKIEYFPKGLRPAIPLAVLGLLLAACASVFAAYSARALRSPETRELSR